ncbi:hypothetical protein L873DRAFT_1843290 [Choiromyces venosus 120613-1]|uniref:Uncharacterized protein n=1 Tax=Choiromyces venosus 120613-1 TaxID=1336337 RepID=A0A3N4JPB5_9PEZI|nr:hypothetical protein L873DRAFT_1843290 [Choiromyces venosus 120613-1]
MVKHYNKLDRISDWQHYLHEEVLVHPAWRSYPKIKDFEINPHIPICVRYWEGENIQPAANELLGLGIINDLLRLVKNPKFLDPPSKISGTGKGGKSPTEPIKMAYTVHIRFKGDSSSSDNKSQSSSDNEDNLLDRNDSELLTEHHLSDGIVTSSNVTPTFTTIQKQHPRRKPNHRRSKGKAIAIPSSSDSESDPITKPSSSPKKCSTPPLSNQSSRDSTSLIVKAILPSTPPTTQIEPASHSSKNSKLIPQSQPLRKRSLTLMSPEKVTTLNPRDTKKYRNFKHSPLLYSGNEAEDSSNSTDVDSPTD